MQQLTTQRIRPLPSGPTAAPELLVKSDAISAGNVSGSCAVLLFKIIVNASIVGHYTTVINPVMWHSKMKILMFVM